MTQVRITGSDASRTTGNDASRDNGIVIMPKVRTKEAETLLSDG